MNYLYSSTEWRDKHGVVHKLEDMDESYRRNCLNLLRRNARSLLFNAWDWASDTAMRHDGGDMAQDSLDNTASDLWELLELGREVEWVEDLPIVKALCRSLGLPPERDWPYKRSLYPGERYSV